MLKFGYVWSTRTLNLIPLIVDPEALFHPNFSIKVELRP